MTSTTTSSENLDHFQRGLFRRIRHLTAWTIRIRARIGRIQTGASEELSQTPGVQGLIDYSNAFLDRARGILTESGNVIQRLGNVPRSEMTAEQVDAELQKIWDSCGNVENILRHVEAIPHPILAGRCASDLRYDNLVAQILNEIAPDGFGADSLRIHPVFTHRVRTESAASVRSFTFQPNMPKMQVPRDRYNSRIIGAFMVFPSVRSLTTLTFLLHEIGHIVWEVVLSDNQRWRLVELMDRAFQNASVSGSRGRSKIRLRAEIFADCFAALVGGNAYSATLCGFLFTKVRLWKNSPVEYLSVCDRARLVRIAARRITPQCPCGTDSFFAAFDALKTSLCSIPNLDDLPQSWPGAEEHEDDSALLTLIDALADALRTIQVRLADEIVPIKKSKYRTPPNEFRSDRLRQLLLIASKYRDECPDDDGAQYITWEKDVVNNLGIPTSDS